MSIQIKGDGAVASVKVDGVELSNFATGFILKQEAGCIAELTLTIPVTTELSVDLPGGVAVIERNTECGQGCELCRSLAEYAAHKRNSKSGQSIPLERTPPPESD